MNAVLLDCAGVTAEKKCSSHYITLEQVKLKTRCTEIQKKLSPCRHRAYTL